MTRYGGVTMRAAAQRVTGHLGTGLSRMIGARAGQRIAILMYHRIHEDVPGLPPPTWNVTPQRFREQMTGLLDRGYQPLMLSQTIDDHLAGRTPPPRSFIVTFDDGYENVYRHAWPVLRELKIPATIFLATAFLDSSRPFPFDDWVGSGSQTAPTTSWRPLTAEQCLEMQQSGLVELGCHTHTHRDFRGRPADLVTDIQQSLQVLRERFGVERAAFALPYGNKDEGFSSSELAAAARQAGVLCGLSTESRLVDVRSDPFDWGRFTAEHFDTAATLSAKLDGWYELARAAWRGLRRPRRSVAASCVLALCLLT